MVKVTQQENRKVYQCEECRMKYLDKEIAQKCEDYCAKYHACNIEYLKYAVKDKDEK